MKILQDDQNFLVEIIDWQGKKAVKKTVKATASASRATRIKNDVLGMNFFSELAESIDLELYVPQVYDSGEGFYIREFINDAPLINESAKLEEAKPQLDKLAQLLAQLDQQNVKEELGYKGSSNYQNIGESVPRWADENVADGIITAEQAARAKELAAKLAQYSEPSIAHGDMNPFRHAYLRPDGKITLIDYENFSSRHARYYDVAWGYTRLYSFASTTDIPRYFLSSFLNKASTIDHQNEQLMLAITQRTLGMQKDAEQDLKNKGIDFRDRAKELLEIVLNGDINLLY